MTYTLTLSRTLKRKRDQKASLTEFAKGLKNKPKWRVTKCVSDHQPAYNSERDDYTYVYKFYFGKETGKKTEDLLLKEWTGIVSNYQQIAEAKRWGEAIWVISDVSPEPSIESQLSGPTESEAADSKAQFGLPDKILALAEVRDRVIPQIDKMLEDERELQSVFGGIFDREAQIRTVLSSVKSFLTTNGQRRNHVLLYGLPACAKTQILLKLKDFLGDGAVVRLDATSTTQAGIYKLFFDLDDAIPPFVFIEEIEKTAEDALRVWLGALDDRGELRKMNFNMNMVREVRVLCLATANDKTLLDRLMGGRDGHPGALSSRFVNQLYCNRPDKKVMEMILRRDIVKFGGNDLWIEPILKLADQLNTNDPRKVLAFLDGGDRLLTGEYQEDILKVMDKESEEMRTEPGHVDVTKLNNLVDSEMRGDAA